MLHLASQTRPDWLPQAVAHLPEILVDHAHCEKKAASTAMNLIFRYVDQPDLVSALSPLAREELEHFEQVLELLAQRGIPLARLEPSPYAGRLHKAVRKAEPHRLLDTLLCCALIEARSCERMKLMAEGLSAEASRLADPSLDQLAEFYRSLLASEARHFATYTDLATARFGRESTARRLRQLAEHEAACLAEPSPAVRLHS